MTRAPSDTLEIPAPPFSAVQWVGGTGGHLRLIDQRRLPADLTHLECRSVDDVWHAIRGLAVRGAPAIGIAAAYAVVIGASQGASAAPPEFLAAVDRAASHLATSRPTAVNLFWAIGRMRQAARRLAGEIERGQLAAGEWLERLLAEARRIHDEDRAMCRAMGRWGETLVPDQAGVLTHCNTGGLATGGYGTALGVIVTAHLAGKQPRVYADETRPLLQGSRLTMWELQQWQIPATLICDSMAGQLMRDGKVDVVLTGADRIAANGDTANKIGTYSLAVLARHHGIPFYIVAPTSTFDQALAAGDAIPIEMRDPSEVTHWRETITAPNGTVAHNPAFDVTPAEYISAIVTDQGIVRPVTGVCIDRVLGWA